jgi:hypothetical protein
MSRGSIYFRFLLGGNIVLFVRFCGWWFFILFFPISRGLVASYGCFDVVFLLFLFLFLFFCFLVPPACGVHADSCQTPDI